MQLVKEKLTKSSMLLVIVAAIIAALAVILFGVQQFKIGSQLASVNQVANLSHVLVRQQANLLSVLLINNSNSEQLAESLDDLLKQQFILDATIYDSNGKQLAQSRYSGNLREQLGLDPSQQKIPTQQIVEPIYANGGVRGFLRVTFDAQYAQTTQSQIDRVFHRLYGEILLVFLLGALLSGSIYYFIYHYRRAYRNKSSEAKRLPVLVDKKPSQRFHSRRRRN